MALLRSSSPPGRRTRDAAREQRFELSRLEERQENARRATAEWLSLLREMEGNGETNSPNYERYYQAYLQAKQQQKAAELDLFNRRRGLIG